MHLWHPRDGLAVTDAADSHGSAEDALLLGRDALAHGAARLVSVIEIAAPGTRQHLWLTMGCYCSFVQAG
jgi:hypothetical protein